MFIIQEFNRPGVAILQLEAQDAWDTSCQFCGQKLKPGDRIVHVGFVGDYLHDGCVVTLAMKITTLRRRESRTNTPAISQ